MDVSLTQVLHTSVKNAANGLPANTLAKLLGKPYSTLMLELGTEKSHKLDADLVIPIITMTKSKDTLDFIAQKCGGVFLQLPKFEEIKKSHITEATLETVRTFGGFLAKLSPSIADGIINKKEYQHISKGGQEAVTAVMALMEYIKKLHKSQYGHLYERK